MSFNAFSSKSLASHKAVLYLPFMCHNCAPFTQCKRGKGSLLALMQLSKKVDETETKHRALSSIHCHLKPRLPSPLQSSHANTSPSAPLSTVKKLPPFFPPLSLFINFCFPWIALSIVINGMPLLVKLMGCYCASRSLVS